MIQRYIYTALQSGLLMLKSKPEILELFFSEQYDLTATEIAAIRKAFEAKPPTIIHGYAHIDMTLPLIAIVLANEGESQNVIGDDGGMVDEAGDPDFGADIETAIWQHNYDIMVMTDHPDLTLYYYELVKQILITNTGGVGYFADQGLFGSKVSGMDMAPDPRYLPEHAFVRVIRFVCEREFQTVDRGSKVGKAFKVSGIFVDKTGSPSDVGGVHTLVKPY